MRTRKERQIYDDIQFNDEINKIYKIQGNRLAFTGREVQRGEEVDGKGRKVRKGSGRTGRMEGKGKNMG